MFGRMALGYILGIASIINFIRWCQHSPSPKPRDVTPFLGLEEKYNPNPGPGNYKYSPPYPVPKPVPVMSSPLIPSTGIPPPMQFRQGWPP